MSRPRQYDYGALAHVYATVRSIDRVMEQTGASRATVVKALRASGIGPRRQRPITTTTRHRLLPLSGRRASLPPYDSAAIAGSRTLYPTTVVSADTSLLLKSGINTSKIGKVVLKGRWKGFPIYTLTLEERATCPTSCRHWRSCFGNAMHFAQRIAHGRELEDALLVEIAALARRHRGGFAVRLHVLGEFYSVGYVRLWDDLLDRHPELHVFGFSARWDVRADPIADALVRLAYEKWERFAIRFSNAPVDTCSTVTVETPDQAPADAIVCPQQIGRTAACATCALCWQTDRRIAFIQH